MGAMDGLSPDAPALSRHGIPAPHVRALAEVYGLGRPTGPLEVIDVGVSNAMWKLHTEKGVFAIKGHQSGAREAQAGRSAQFETEMSAAGVPTAEVLRTRRGRFAATIRTADGRGEVLVRVHRWLPARGPQTSSPGMLLQLGRALGRAHAAAPRTDQAIGAWQSRPVTAKEWGEVIRAARAQSVPWAGKLALAAAGYLAQRDLVAAASRPRERVLAHGDLSPENSVNSGFGFRAIDFDGPVPLAPAEELAMVAANWLHRGAGKEPVAGAFLLDGYREGRGADVRVQLEDFGPYLAGKHNWVLENARIALGLDVGPKWGPDQATAYMLAAIDGVPNRRDCERIVASLNSEVGAG